MGLQTTISNLLKMAESSQKGEKTQWEKEKLLIASNFSFSHSVFKRPVLQTRKNQGLFGKGLNVSSIYTHFNTMKKKTLWKTLLKKMKLLKMSNFTYFQNVFYAICILISLKATFQLSSAASLNLGQFQNGVLGNGLNSNKCSCHKQYM